MSSANVFVSHLINSAFIPRPVPLCYIVDYKEKYIHMIYLPSSAYFRSSDISVTYARISTLSRSSEFLRHCHSIHVLVNLAVVHS